MAHKVILPPQKNYIPQFLKQRDINSYISPDKKVDICFLHVPTWYILGREINWKNIHNLTYIGSEEISHERINTHFSKDLDSDRIQSLPEIVSTFTQVPNQT